VYNETIRDLLAPTHIRGKDRQRTVHAHPKHGVHIDGLSRCVVSTTDECLDLIAFGNQMRAMATTTMNSESSRSHAIFTFRMQGNGHSSTFTFVDLAGREDQTASDNKAMQLREMCYINTSLFHLAHLITKLSEGKLEKGSLAAFRNSKLTLLLSQALIGNCKTSLIATMAPAVEYFDDTLSTLHFAQQVKRVETQPQVNKKAPTAMVKDLQDELSRLQRELQQATQSNTETEQELFAAQAMIRHMQASPQDVLEASKAARKQRQSLMGELGLHQEAAAMPVDANGEIVPFFTKLSDDTSLQGCCNYFITRSALRFGSQRGLCDVVLQGVGVTPTMCMVASSTDDARKVVVTLLGDEDDIMSGLDSVLTESSTGESEVYVAAPAHVPRVLINGQPLMPDGNSSLTMEHGDCLVLGYAHAFRLVVPAARTACITEEEDEEEGEEQLDGTRRKASCIAQETLSDLSLQGALAEVGAETSDQFQHVMPALLQYGMRAENESIVNSLKLKLTTVCPLVDEANTITEEIFGTGVMRFLSHVMNDRPGKGRDRLQLVVSVYECVNAAVNIHKDEEAWSPGPRSPGRVRRGRLSVGGAGGGGARVRMGDRLLPRHSNSIFGSLGLSNLDPDKEVSLDEVEPEDQLLYVWPVDKFLRRLREMREVYQAGCAMGDRFRTIRSQLRQNRHLNPWHEAAVTEVKMLMEGEGDSRTTVGIARKSIAGEESPQRQRILSDTRARVRTDIMALIAEEGQEDKPDESARPMLPLHAVGSRSTTPRGGTGDQTESKTKVTDASQQTEESKAAATDGVTKVMETKDSSEQGVRPPTAERKEKLSGSEFFHASPVTTTGSAPSEEARRGAAPTRRSQPTSTDADLTIVYDPSSSETQEIQDSRPTESEEFAAQLRILATKAEKNEAAEILSMLKPMHTRLQNLERKCESIPEEVLTALSTSGLGASLVTSACCQSPRTMSQNNLSQSQPARATVQTARVEAPKVSTRKTVGTAAPTSQKVVSRVVRRFVSAPSMPSGVDEHAPSPCLTPRMGSPPAWCGAGQHSWVCSRPSPRSQTPTQVPFRASSPFNTWPGSLSLPRSFEVKSTAPPQPVPPSFVVAPPSRMKAMSPARGSPRACSPQFGPPLIKLTPRGGKYGQSPSPGASYTSAPASSRGHPLLGGVHHA